MKIHAPRKGSLQFERVKAKSIIPQGGKYNIFAMKAGMFHSRLKSTKAVEPLTVLQLVPLIVRKKVTEEEYICELQYAELHKGQKSKVLRTIRTTTPLKEGDNVNEHFNISDVNFVNVTSVTKGKGFSGPVKRYGIKLAKRKGLRANKHRHIGCVAPRTPSKVSWRTAQAGHLGFSQRTHFNIKVVSMSDIMDEIPKVFNNYGLVSASPLFLKGSIPGCEKRTIRIQSNERN